jgi:hypothetical protein
MDTRIIRSLVYFLNNQKHNDKKDKYGWVREYWDDTWDSYITQDPSKNKKYEIFRIVEKPKYNSGAIAYPTNRRNRMIQQQDNDINLKKEYERIKKYINENQGLHYGPPDRTTLPPRRMLVYLRKRIMEYDIRGNASKKWKKGSKQRKKEEEIEDEIRKDIDNFLSKIKKGDFDAKYSRDRDSVRNLLNFLNTENKAPRNKEMYEWIIEYWNTRCIIRNINFLKINFNHFKIWVTPEPNIFQVEYTELLLTYNDIDKRALKEIKDDQIKDLIRKLLDLNNMNSRGISDIFWLIKYTLLFIFKIPKNKRIHNSITLNPDFYRYIDKIIRILYTLYIYNIDNPDFGNPTTYETTTGRILSLNNIEYIIYVFSNMMYVCYYKKWKEDLCKYLLEGRGIPHNRRNLHDNIYSLLMYFFQNNVDNNITAYDFIPEPETDTTHPEIDTTHISYRDSARSLFAHGLPSEDDVPF